MLASLKQILPLLCVLRTMTFYSITSLVRRFFKQRGTVLTYRQ